MIALIKKYWVLALVLVLIFGWSYWSYVSDGIVYSIVASDLDSIVDYINSFGALAAIVLVLLTIVEVVAAPIPPLILYIAAGLIFGTVYGGSLVLLGNIIGAIIAFFIGRKFGRYYVEKKVSKKKREDFDRFSSKYGGFAIFFLRINPITSSDIFSYLSGLTKMRFSSFVIGTALGLAPLVYFQTYIGSDLIKGNPFLSLVFIWAGVFYLALFLYGIFWLAKKKN
jgi:uncharacterized membrane protein YdjX (TVP38/TMEM64 family)